MHSKEIIGRFDRSNLSDLRNEINDALKAVAERHGIRVSVLGQRYTEKQCTTKIEFIIPTGVVKSSAPTRMELEQYVKRKYKSGQRIFTVNSVNGDGTFSATTNRGAGYRVTKEQLDGMALLTFAGGLVR